MIAAVPSLYAEQIRRYVAIARPAGRPTLKYRKSVGRHGLSGIGISWAAGADEIVSTSDPRPGCPSAQRTLQTARIGSCVAQKSLTTVPWPGSSWSMTR